MGERKEKSPSGQIAAQPFLTQLLQVELVGWARRRETRKIPARKVTTTSRVINEIRDSRRGKRDVYLSFSLAKEVRKEQ